MTQTDPAARPGRAPILTFAVAVLLVVGGLGVGGIAPADLGALALSTLDALTMIIRAVWDGVVYCALYPFTLIGG